MWLVQFCPVSGASARVTDPDPDPETGPTALRGVGRLSAGSGCLRLESWAMSVSFNHSGD